MKENCRFRSPICAISSERWLTAVGLAPSALAMFWLVSKARWFWSHNPELQFGWVVMVLWGYLLWEVWGKRPETKFEWTFGAVLTGLIGLALLFLTQLYQAALGLTPASMSGLGAGVLLLVAANLNYAFGRPGARHFGLQSNVAAINVEVLNLFGVPAEKAGQVIRLPGCVVGIDEACSGIRSLQSTAMATLFIGNLTLRRTSLRALLFFVGILLAIFGNLARSMLLSFTANAGGVEAIQSYHDAAGWSILAFTAFGVMLFSWWLSKLEAAMNRPAAGPMEARDGRPMPT
ncbi:MAG: exosortase [Verrucomicrobia bacterium]|nr:MAG: exosortase [Verrucomicrobiota bacterium]